MAGCDPGGGSKTAFGNYARQDVSWLSFLTTARICEVPKPNGCKGNPVVALFRLGGADHVDYLHAFDQDGFLRYIPMAGLGGGRHIFDGTHNRHPFDNSAKDTITPSSSGF